MTKSDDFFKWISKGAFYGAMGFPFAIAIGEFYIFVTFGEKCPRWLFIATVIATEVLLLPVSICLGPPGLIFGAIYYGIRALKGTAP